MLNKKFKLTNEQTNQAKKNSQGICQKYIAKICLFVNYATFVFSTVSSYKMIAFFILSLLEWNETFTGEIF